MYTHIKHSVVEMDESRIQRCVLCGEIIHDYSNSSWPVGQPAPSGFPAGEVFVKDGNPIELSTYITNDETAISCQELEIESSNEFEDWLKTRPAIIQELGRNYPPGEYIIKDGAPYGVSCPGTKVHLNAYCEDGTISVIVKAEDKLPQALEHEARLCIKHGNNNAAEIQASNIQVYVDPKWLQKI